MAANVSVFFPFVTWKLADLPLPLLLAPREINSQGTRRIALASYDAQLGRRYRLPTTLGAVSA